MDLTLEEIEHGIRAATTIDALNEAADLLRTVRDTCGEPDRWRLINQLAGSRAREISAGAAA